MRRQGRFIVIEGIDQSGKETQSRLLAQSLSKSGFRSQVISFPEYRTGIGRMVRKSLSDSSYPLEVRHLLLSANRWELKERIEKLLAEDIILISNRYSRSNLAYGMANRLSERWLKSLDEGLPEPDLTVLIDIPPRLSLGRKAQNRDVHERDLRFLSRVRKIYLKIAAREGWSVVDGRGDISVIGEQVLRTVRKSLQFRGGKRV